MLEKEYKSKIVDLEKKVDQLTRAKNFLEKELAGANEIGMVFYTDLMEVGVTIQQIMHVFGFDKLIGLPPEEMKRKVGKQAIKAITEMIVPDRFSRKKKGSEGQFDFMQKLIPIYERHNPSVIKYIAEMENKIEGGETKLIEE